VAWWQAEKKELGRAARMLQLENIEIPNRLEVFASLIRIAAHPDQVDRRTVSKWSRVLRLSSEMKKTGGELKAFIKSEGGLNGCAQQYCRCLGRHARNWK
jgi:hypothetical protein